MTETIDERPIHGIEELLFLVGEWRGRGRLDFQSGAEEFTSSFTCLKSPDGTSVEIIQFDDDPSTERTFYAEHLRISPRAGSDGFEVLRKGFAYADVGDTLMELHEAVTSIPGGIRIAAGAGSANFLLNDVRILKEGDESIRYEGSAGVGKDSWTLEFHFTRRSPA